MAQTDMLPGITRFNRRLIISILQNKYNERTLCQAEMTCDRYNHDYKENSLKTEK